MPHDSCLAVFHAGRQLPPLCPGGTKVTELGGEGDVIYTKTFRPLGYNLIELYPPFPGWITVLLLAGYLAGVASGAIFIFNK